MRLVEDCDQQQLGAKKDVTSSDNSFPKLGCSLKSLDTAAGVQNTKMAHFKKEKKDAN